MRWKKWQDDSEEMTAMVDVTFLLLIFFMVTTTLIASKAFAVDQQTPDDPVIYPVEFEDEDDYIGVYIDEFDRIEIVDRDETASADSKAELFSIIRDMSRSSGIDRLAIYAHNKSRHQKVVEIYDAANAAGITQIRMMATNRIND